MVTRLFVAAALSFPLAAFAARPPAKVQEERQEWTLESTFLYDGGDGQIWIGLPVAGIGMIGVEEMPPTRLSPEVSRRLAPLLTAVDTPRPGRDPWWFNQLPKVRGNSPVILLGLRVKIDERNSDSPRTTSSPSRSEMYEIVEARLLNVEFITREWHDAWLAADQSLKEIISVTQSASGPGKKRRLSDAVDKAARSLDVMYRAQVGDEWAARARKVEPTVRVIRSFQRRVGEDWQRHLEKYAELLRIPMPINLPPPVPRLDSVKLLAESGSAEELISQVRKSWPEDMLEARLIYSSSLQRTVYVRDVTELSPHQFDTLRLEAKRQISDRNRRPPAAAPAEQPRTQAVEPLHIVVSAAGPDLLASRLVLGGLTVDQVIQPGPGVDLKPGDLIINYNDTYDAGMSAGNLERSAKWLANLTRYGGKLNVLRDNQAITVTLPKSQPAGIR